MWTLKRRAAKGWTDAVDGAMTSPSLPTCGRRHGAILPDEPYASLSCPLRIFAEEEEDTI